MTKVRVLAILNLLAFAIQLAVTWLTQRKMINDADVAEISQRYASLITPAGITFAVWGVIYLLLLVFCCYHIVNSWRHASTEKPNRDVLAIGPLFIFNNLATAAWLYYWTHAYILAALFLIILQLITLAVICRRLHIYDRNAGVGSKIFTQPAFCVYFGWITVATIENAESFLESTGWEGLGLSDSTGAIIMLAVAVFIGLCMVYIGRNLLFGVVVVWALIGILLRQAGGGAPAYPEVVLAAEIGIIVMGLSVLIQAVRNISFHRLHRNRDYTIFPEAPRPVK